MCGWCNSFVSHNHSCVYQGGSVSAGMAIYDTMQYVPCDVSTVWYVVGLSNFVWVHSSFPHIQHYSCDNNFLSHFV